MAHSFHSVFSEKLVPEEVKRLPPDVVLRGDVLADCLCSTHVESNSGRGKRMEAGGRRGRVRQIDQVPAARVNVTLEVGLAVFLGLKTNQM